jgi:predicted transcriptional regulator
MDSLEEVSGLYFELSNIERLKIMVLLSEKALRLTEIAESIDTTHQQCLRHLKRLSEIQLVDKNTEGMYQLTSYGELVLKLTPSLEFITKHRDYFNTHSLSKIPIDFIYRISELNESIQINNVMEAISEMESIIKNSEKYINVIINKRTHSIRPYVADAMRRDVQVSSISITSYVPTIDVKRDINLKDELDIIEAEKTGAAKVADQVEFPLYLYSTEKSIFIAFPLHDGTFDYTGFYSTKPEAVKYCRDLFDYYWSKTKIIPVLEIVDRHKKYLESFGLDLTQGE